MVIAKKDGTCIRIPDYKSGYYKALGYEVSALEPVPEPEPSGEKPTKKDQKKAGSDADAD